MENTQITKKDNNTIEVVKTMPVAFSFTPEYLKAQREAIIKQRDEFVIQRNKEIEEIDGYLSEMTKLGVSEKVIEEVKDEILEEVIKE